MDPSTQQKQQHHHLHQEMGSDQTLESMLECRKEQQQEKKAIRPAEESLKCPRCDSTNTKFCYYNNYSLTQPRYFCKSCRRYWTKGGTLRNVPVGGGCRKNNKRSSSSSSSLSSSKRAQDQSLISSPNTYNNNPLSSLITGLSTYDQSDQISLAIARLQNQNQNQNHHFGQMGFEHGYSIFGNNPTSNNNDDHVDALRGGYFENPSLINGFHNQNHQLFGGTGINMLGHNENGAGGFLRNLGLINGSEEMGIINSSSMAAAAYGDQEMGGNCGIATTSTAVTTVKQEGENRVLLAGFPWQFGGADQTGNMVDFEPPVKPSWNGFGSSSWHGLLNSPLM